MNRETYERLEMNITRFDVEDVITTSAIGGSGGGGAGSGGSGTPDFSFGGGYELPIGF